MYEHLKDTPKNEDDTLNSALKFITHTVIKISRKV